VFNYGLLTAGTHTIGARAGSFGDDRLIGEHAVTVVRPGEFEFLDQFDFSGATAQIVTVHPWSVASSNEEIRLTGVQVRDKATQQTKVIAVDLRWFENAQALGIVATSE
jgi:hypothetical protein